MSEVKTNKVSPVGANGTVTLGDSGDTITIPSGVTLTGFGTNAPAFEAQRQSDLSISDNTMTKVTLDTEIFDTDGAYDPTTNYRFTVPSGEGGKYFVYADITFHSSHGDQDIESLELNVKKNGSTAMNSEFKLHSSYGGQTFTANQSNILTLAASDYLELWGLFDNTQGSTYTKIKAATLGAFKLIGI